MADNALPGVLCLSVLLLLHKVLKLARVPAPIFRVAVEVKKKKEENTPIAYNGDANPGYFRTGSISRVLVQEL